MTYEDPNKIKPSKGVGKKTVVKAAQQLGTFTLLGIIIRRHKVGLLATWAITVTTVQLFPFAPALVLTALGQ